LWALAAGLAFGVGAYGFHSLRLQLPLTLAAALLASPGSAFARLSERTGRATALALFAGFLVPFVPLAIVSFNDPESLHRWQMTRLWPPGASLPVVLRLVAERWAIHFAPDFLFLRGDRYSMLNPARAAALSWWMLPGLLAGTLFTLARWKRDPRAR